MLSFTYTYTGCYDSYVYFIDINTGLTYWKFKTNDIVKSSPTCIKYINNNHVTGNTNHVIHNKNHAKEKVNHVITGNRSIAMDNKNTVTDDRIHVTNDTVVGISSTSLQITFIACHDKYLYALNHTTKTLLWKYNTNGLCTSAALVTTTATRGSLDLVYVALLTGKVLAIEQLTGRLEWQFMAGKPIFTSPGFFGRHRIVFGCADGMLYCLEAARGSLLWKFETGAPIFSSPTITDYYYDNHNDSYSHDDEPDSGIHYIENDDFPSKRCTQNTDAAFENEPDGNYYSTERDNSSSKRFKQDSTANMKCDNFPKRIWHNPIVKNESDKDFNDEVSYNYTSKRFKHEDTSMKKFEEFSSKYNTSTKKKRLFCCFGSNDGYLYTLDEQGCLVWKARIGVPVVSSPAILNSIVESRFPVLKRDESDSDAEVKKNLAAAVEDSILDFSAVPTKNLPIVSSKLPRFSLKRDQSESDSSVTTTTTISTRKMLIVPTVFCIDTKGGFHMFQLETGRKVAVRGITHSNGEVFSSPVIVGNRIVFGSRDDHVYFLETS